MPSLLDHDLHVHTYLSDCCHDKVNHRPAAILQTAERMRLETIGFADHVWVNPDLEPNDWYRKQGASQIDRLSADLEEVSSYLRILVGCEAETIAPGCFGMTRAFAETLDFVLLACSHLHIRPLVAQPKSDAPRDIATHLRDMFVSAASSGLATGIPHPLMASGFMDQYDEVIAAFSDDELTDAFGVAAENRVGIEITTSFIPPEPSAEGRPVPRWSIETPLRVLAMAKRAGCLFYFATDAHELSTLERLGFLTSAFVDELDLGPGDILPFAKGPLP